MPGPISLSPVSRDTGWVANSSVGDKTAVVTDYVNGIDGTMVTALNVVSTGLGTAISALADAVVLVRKKQQAIETALASGKLPNA